MEISATRDAPPAIAANGWYYHDACACGAFRIKYRHPDLVDLELEWIPRQRLFRVTYRGSSTKIPPTRIEQLEKILTALNENRQ
jgi:hypothetical protein